MHVCLGTEKYGKKKEKAQGHQWCKLNWKLRSSDSGWQCWKWKRSPSLAPIDMWQSQRMHVYENILPSLSSSLSLSTSSSPLLSLFCLSLYLALILCVTYVCLNLFMPYPFLQCPMCSLFLSLCTLILLSLCFSILSKCSISLPSINHLSLYLSTIIYLPTLPHSVFFVTEIYLNFCY